MYKDCLFSGSKDKLNSWLPSPADAPIMHQQKSNMLNLILPKLPNPATSIERKQSYFLQMHTATRRTRRKEESTSIKIINFFLSIIFTNKNNVYKKMNMHIKEMPCINADPICRATNVANTYFNT